VSRSLVCVVNDTVVNAETVKELLLKISRRHRSIPITIVLDNARYQRCYAVQDYARELGIELLFLPSYSPNLNLIERLWKFVKRQCLYSEYYSDFASFRCAIAECLDELETKHGVALKSLLTLRFQTFEDIKKSA
jgi:transposase